MRKIGHRKKDDCLRGTPDTEKPLLDQLTHLHSVIEGLDKTAIGQDSKFREGMCRQMRDFDIRMRRLENALNITL